MIKKIIFWLFFSFLVCLVALSIWIRVDSTSKLNAIEARLEMAGAAMTIGELLPEPVPEDLNAALLYLELKALDEAYDVRDEVYDRLAEVSEADLSSGEVYRFKISEAEWGIVDELLQDKRLEAQLDLIHRIAARPYFQPDWQYEAGPAMMIPEVGVARMAAELLLIKAAQALRSGDIGTVHQNLQEVIVLSKHAEQCPNLISYLTGIALRGLASMFLEAATVERGSTAGFDPSLWQHAVHDLWQRPMDGERLCMGEIVYEAVIEADADAFEAFNGSPAPKKFAALRLSPVASYFRYDYVFYLEYMEAARGMEGQFYNEYTELSKRLDEQMFSADLGRYRHVLSSILIPAMGKVREVAYRSDAQNIVNYTALQLAKFKREQGDYPEQLAELVPGYCESLPVDLFNGEPLIYRKEGELFALYSVGPNFADDRGTTNEQGQADEDEGDIIWAGFGSALTRTEIE